MGRILKTYILKSQVETPQGKLPNVDTSHIYHGHVLGEGNSHVFGSIIDGIFEGKIITDTNSFYVEHAKRYFPNGTHQDYGFHSVIYDERDVIDDPFANENKTSDSNGCGINDEVVRWMNDIQSSAVENESSETENSINSPGIEPSMSNKKLKYNSMHNKNDLNLPFFKYTKEANDEENDEYGKLKYLQKRSRRAARPKEDNRNTCSLYIQTDPLIWRHIRDGIADVSSYSCLLLIFSSFIRLFKFCSSMIEVESPILMRKLGRRFYH